MSFLTQFFTAPLTATNCGRAFTTIVWSGENDIRCAAIIARMLPPGYVPVRSETKLTIADVADDLGLTDTAILKLIKAKKFPTGRGPRSQRFWLESDIAAWLDAADCRSIN